MYPNTQLQSIVYEGHKKYVILLNYASFTIVVCTIKHIIEYHDKSIIICPLINGDNQKSFYV